MLDHVNIARFISSYESKYNLSIQEFLTESDREEIIGLKLIKGKKNNIFNFAINDINTFLEKKLKNYLNEDLLVSHTCILKLTNPAPPHIDGHFPFSVHNNKIYCIIKVFIVPLAFDTDLDATAIETGIVAFKQHYCKPRAAGYEFFHLLQENITFEYFSFVDKSNLPLTKHSNFYADKNIFKYLNSEKIKQGLDIDRISYLKLGDLSTLNPYQVHCSTDFEDKFSVKYVLRFAILKSYDKSLLKDYAITDNPHQLLWILKSNF